MDQGNIIRAGKVAAAAVGVEALAELDLSSRIDPLRPEPYISPMIRSRASLLLTVLLVAGCTPSKTPVRDEMFGPAAIRVHPTFTQLKEGGIEALVEVQDSFGEPTRAAGRVMFELYEYRPHFPEPRGARVGGPWMIELLSTQEQEAHWNRAVRAYTFQLPFSPPADRKSFVLSASFTVYAAGQAQGRLFDELVLERGRGRGQ